MRPREVMRILRANGWVLIRVTGSHYRFEHPSRPGAATVAMHNKDVKIGTIKSIENATGVRLR